MKMEKNEFENLEVGKESEKLKAKKVEIKDYEIIETFDKETKQKVGDKVKLIAKHPDKEEAIEISKCKYEKNGKVTISGLWITLDAEGKIPYGSALAHLLRFYEVNGIYELKGEKVETSQDDEGYLCIKAY